MYYYIGQAAGILCLVGLLIQLQMKTRKGICLMAAILNTLSIINVYFITDFKISTVIATNALAVIQGLSGFVHGVKNTEIKKPEKVIFIVAYLALCAISYRTPLDIFAIVATVFYLIAFTMNDEQLIRIFLLCNMSTWLAYDIVIGSTAALAQAAGIISGVIGIFRFAGKKKENE